MRLIWTTIILLLLASHEPEVVACAAIFICLVDLWRMSPLIDYPGCPSWEQLYCPGHVPVHWFKLGRPRLSETSTQVHIGMIPR